MKFKKLLIFGIIIIYFFIIIKMGKKQEKWLETVMTKITNSIPISSSTKRVFRLNTTQMTFTEYSRTGNNRKDLIEKYIPEEEICRILKIMNEEAQYLKTSKIETAVTISILIIVVLIFISSIIFLITYEKGKYVAFIGLIVFFGFCLFGICTFISLGIISLVQRISLNSYRRKLEKLIKQRRKLDEDGIDENQVLWTIGSYGLWFSIDMMFLYNHVNELGFVVDRRNIKSNDKSKKRSEKERKNKKEREKKEKGINDYTPLPYVPPGMNVIKGDDKNKSKHRFERIKADRELPPILDLKAGKVKKGDKN